MGTNKTRNSVRMLFLTMLILASGGLHSYPSFFSPSPEHTWKPWNIYNQENRRQKRKRERLEGREDKNYKNLNGTPTNPPALTKREG